MRAHLGMAMLLAALACHCGGSPKPPKEPQLMPDEGGAPVGGARPPGVGPKVQKLTVYPKVPDAYRQDFRAEDFVPDVSGDSNRDPFRSYFLQLSQKQGQPLNKWGANRPDACKGRRVADVFGLRELQLVGVVLRGTKSYALFHDGKRGGHIAHRGDCLSKDQARLKQIGADRVILEIQAEAPPGAPAPPPREEAWQLHPEELELGHVSQPGE